MSPVSLLFIVPLLLGMSLFGTLIHWASLRLLNVPVTELSVFYGSPVIRTSVRGLPVSIGWFPTGGSVAFDVPSYNSKPLLARLALVLSPVPVYLSIAIVCLGWDDAIHHFVGGFSQLVAGALHPLTTAQTLIARLEAQPGLAVVGIIAAKLAASVVLPLGGTSLAQCIREILWPWREHEAMMTFLTLSAVGGFVLVLLWMLAVAVHAFESFT